VSQIEQTCADLLRRILNVPTEDNGAPLDAAEIHAKLRELTLVVRQDLSEPLTAYDTQRLQIHMLDSDETVLTNIHFITQSIVGKRQLLNNLIDVRHRNANMTPEEQQQNPHANFLAGTFAWAADHQLTSQITSARGDLTYYVTSRLNPQAVGTVERVLQQWPDVLQRLGPTHVIIPNHQQHEPDPPPSAPADPAGDSE
jgi:hypothetical protein